MVDSVSNSVTNAATGATSSTLQPRLVRAAHDFEASMMSELMKPLQNDPLFSEDDSDSSSSSGSGNALTEFSSESLGRALSEHGGFGIAKRILDHFASQEAEKSTTSNKNSLPLTGANY
jgi:peptidoglycan hydrolase FlgJ